MNAKENFENKELPLKNDDLSDSNVTPAASDDAMNEVQYQKKETKGESIKEEEASTESINQSKDLPESVSKEYPDSDNNTSVEMKETISTEKKPQEKTVDDESKKEVNDSEELKGKESTEPPSSSADKKTEVETTDSETEEKTEDSTPGKKSVEKPEEKIVEKKEEKAPASETPEIQSKGLTDTVSKEEPDSDKSISADTKEKISTEEKSEEKTVDDESKKEANDSEELKGKESTEPPSSSADKKTEVETTDSETERKPEDSTPDEKSVDKSEENIVEKKEEKAPASETPEIQSKELPDSVVKENPDSDKSISADTKEKNSTEKKSEEKTVDDESKKEVSDSEELKKEESTESSSSSADKKTDIETTDSETEKKPEDSTPEQKSVEKPEEKIIKKREAKSPVSETPVILTFEQIVENLRKLSKKETFARKELDRAQYLFLSECKKEIDSQKEDFLKAGGIEEDFVIKESELHTEGKNLLQTLSEKRKQMASDESKVKERNLERKLAIIEEIKELTDSQEDFNKVYQDFKTLQKEWNNIRKVPHAKEHELWKSHQTQVEIFYDRVRLHNEFRDYDFKKNLEQKIGLCESAERLDNEKDVVSAFHQLQKLHKDWRDIGPVARKDRELIWQRFKDISAIINKKYQSHIETLKEKESENYEKKIAICEALEAIDYSVLKTTRDWDAKMREVLNLQDVWREIGYAPRKVNAKIFRRYRAACDLFFKNKNEYYQSIRGELEENLKKKIALCERAEELKNSTDWRATTPQMIDIQREWKEIGMVPRKNSASVWRRFISACDHFFEQKKIHTKSIYETEADNLKLKREVTKKIKNIDTKLSKEDALNAVKALMEEWHAIGFVPYKEKNKAYKEFLDATDAQYARLNIDKSERKLETFKTNISEMTKSDHSRGKVFHERDKLMRQFERMKSDLQTYENNVGFLSSSSKKGNVLVDDMNSKIEKIKDELELIIKKIDAIDAEI